MAEQKFPVTSDDVPTAVESFVADRQSMWSFFTSLATYAVIVLAVLLILMAIFLV